MHKFNYFCSVVLIFTLSLMIVILSSNLVLRASTIYTYHFNDSQVMNQIPYSVTAVDMASAFLRMCHAQSCGKCVPCRVGLGQLQIMIEEILSMDADIDLKILKKLEKTAEVIRVSSDCAIGSEAAAMVLRGLEGFREDYESHILNHCCADNIINQRQSVPCRGGCPAGVDVPRHAGLLFKDNQCEDVNREVLCGSQKGQRL